MLIVVARAVVKPENKAKFIEAARELVEKTRQEPGNISYTLLEGVEADILTFSEQWRDKAALEEHFATEHFQRLIKVLGALQEGPAQMDMYTVAI